MYKNYHFSVKQEIQVPSGIDFDFILVHLKQEFLDIVQLKKNEAILTAMEKSLAELSLDCETTNIMIEVKAVSLAIAEQSIKKITANILRNCLSDF